MSDARRDDDDNDDHRAAPRSACLLYVLTGFAALGGFLFGYDTGVVSGAEVFIREDLGLRTGQIELVVSITVLFAAFGAAVSGMPLQVFGRRCIIMCASLLYCSGSVAIGLAPNLTYLVAGRIILGLGVGLSSMAIPVYISEAAPPRVRGKLVSCYTLSVVLGQAVACGVNVAVQATLDSSLRWRVSMGVAAVPALVQLVGFLWLPESPRWLASKGRTEEAEAVAERLGHDLRREKWEDCSSHENPLTLLTTEPYVRRIFRLGFGLMFVQQLAGINTIMYFGAEILIMCGFPESQSIALTAALALAQGSGVLLSLPLFDKIGRRKLIIPSTLLSAACLAVVSASFGLGIHTEAHRSAALVAVVFYLVAFGAGLSSGPWVVNSEIFPTPLRGLGNAGATTINWLANYVVAAFFLSACQKFGRCATFAGIASIAFSGAVWIFFALPETAGKSLTDADIKDLFSSSSSSRKGRRQRSTGGAYAGISANEDDVAHQPPDARPPRSADQPSPLHLATSPDGVDEDVEEGF